MTSKPRSKEAVEEQISFEIDFKDWQRTLDDLKKKILNYLMLGFKAKDICKLMEIAYAKVTELIRNLKNSFLNYFQPIGTLT